MNDLPILALSVRQPWAWAIIHAGKDIENRSWQAVNWGLNQRGRIAIHASKGLAREEYEDARDTINEILAAHPDFGMRCPEAKDLLRGGIIGTVDVVDVVTESDSDWFFGPRGLVLRNPLPIRDFIPAVGMLGYYTWTAGDTSIVPPPAKWMLPKAEQIALPIAAPKPIEGPNLFALAPHDGGEKA
jgi:hypothetical protein